MSTKRQGPCTALVEDPWTCKAGEDDSVAFATIQMRWSGAWQRVKMTLAVDSLTRSPRTDGWISLELKPLSRVVRHLC